MPLHTWQINSQSLGATSSGIQRQSSWSRDQGAPPEAKRLLVLSQLAESANLF